MSWEPFLVRCCLVVECMALISSFSLFYRLRCAYLFRRFITWINSKRAKRRSQLPAVLLCLSSDCVHSIRLSSRPLPSSFASFLQRLHISNQKEWYIPSNPQTMRVVRGVTQCLLDEAKHNRRLSSWLSRRKVRNIGCVSFGVSWGCREMAIALVGQGDFVHNLT